ncbi:MAG: EamA family transporter [Lachnospiraceae bacterium]|nr:EamA family transporter [Lachnospiraceae bacterium]
MNGKKSVLCVLAAGMLWGCMGILVRTMNGGGFTSLEVTAFRSLVTAVLMLAGMAIFKRKELKVRWKDLWCFVGTGILSVAFFNVCYFTCMHYATLSVAAILLYTAPSFVMIFSYFLFKEQIGRRKLIALALAFAGCVLTSGGLGGAKLSTMGLLTGLGAGLGYALYSIFGKFAIRRGYSSYTITTYTFLFALVGTVPFLNLRHFVICIAEAGGTNLFTYAALTFMTTVAAYLLYTAGLRGMENGRASIIASIEPVMASLVGFFLYKEAFSIPGIIGMILVLTSCVLVG